MITYPRVIAAWTASYPEKFYSYPAASLSTCEYEKHYKFSRFFQIKRNDRESDHSASIFLVSFFQPEKVSDQPLSNKKYILLVPPFQPTS
jgi:hypothetical protein